MTPMVMYEFYLNKYNVSFQTLRLALRLRGYELGLELKLKEICRLGTRTPYRVRATRVLCIRHGNFRFLKSRSRLISRG